MSLRGQPDGSFQCLSTLASHRRREADQNRESVSSIDEKHRAAVKTRVESVRGASRSRLDRPTSRA
jgi:hypothetical protein